jgi:hypothetical protein
VISSTTKQRPPPLGSQTLTVEEHPVHLIEVGRADGALATVVHIPELDAISGDSVYNNIHMWLWNSRLPPAARPG